MISASDMAAKADGKPKQSNSAQSWKKRFMGCVSRRWSKSL